MQKEDLTSGPITLIQHFLQFVQKEDIENVTYGRITAIYHSVSIFRLIVQRILSSPKEVIFSSNQLAFVGFEEI